MLANRGTEKEAPDSQQGAAQRWQCTVNTLCRERKESVMVNQIPSQGDVLWITVINCSSFF